MKWIFKIGEISNGAYECIGKRDTGNIVSLTCGEDEVYRVYQQAYELELEMGTLPGEALFQIVSSAKHLWSTEYNDASFGSWLVEDRETNDRFIYDGKDFYFAAYLGRIDPVWEGAISDLDANAAKVFQLLI
ncbi:hypothetical protein [uncultured Desulfuromusa sp.]|uniref:hypothetical protein n=1 Tax=uncultured Desulfuromusa sp. TaxID=219183 RepID=UPI002AA7BF7A|nr:hypothetical protein [uncultured Desulfuromusa sp.]